MTVPPAKLKAYLATVKQEVIDDKTKDVSQVMKALLLLELVQRGVLPTISLSDASSDDVSKIVDSIGATAGKPLLVDSGVPKPLRAGSCAMAGMVAEKCVSLLKDGQRISLAGLTEASARCKEVNEDRLLALIEVTALTMSSGEPDVNRQTAQLLQIAEGYFLRAASFQPDSPQMWKKALDAIVAGANNSGQEERLEAVFPLDNLIRVAESKGNMKRVSELSLRLTESYLSAPTALDENGKAVAKAFTEPFRTKKLVPSTTKAGKSLKKCDASTLDDDATLWYQALTLKILVDTETTSINEAADEKHASAKNRGTSTSLQSYKAVSRNDILIQTIDNDHDMEAAANALRSTVLNRLEQHDGERLQSAIVLLKNHIERLQERSKVAGIASLKKSKPTCTQELALQSWVVLASFCSPILKEIETVAKSGVEDDSKKEHISEFLSKCTKSMIDFIESCALAVSTYMWMICDRQDNELLSAETQWFLYDLIACLTVYAVTRQKESKQQASKSAVLKASSDGVDVVRRTFECAKAAVFAILNADKSPNQDLTNQAVAFSGDRYVDLTGRFGMSYLLLLTVWSGFRGTPWSYCNITQARAIVKLARSCLSKSTTEWGRKPTPIEKVLLDMAEADVEGGFLLGGFAKVAMKLYRACLDNITTLSRKDHQRVVRSHCLAGLSRLSLAGHKEEPESDETARSITAVSEEFARMSLNEAEGLDRNELGGFYLGSTASLDTTKAFHKSLAQQLVADSLVRAGCPKDAEEFLEAAVRETPDDFVPALSLGAFRLRTAFFPAEGQSATADKSAQIQLLKAAKLNSSKAAPFALLGFWYEEKGDFKRAIGCYSKALVLDPAQPVAGRGIIRLRSYSDVQKICETATNTNSPLNGWAWKAIGVHKAMIDADDDMAAICFQECLRCMDISSPQNESTSVFFLPSEDVIDATPEVADVWSDLAGCYRRLGRYTAAIRAFDSAWLASGESLDAGVLTSWAEVQLELGLVDDASEKFGLALDLKNESVTPVASYGQGCALLSVAQRDAQDGKEGLAHNILTKAIEVVRGILLNPGETSQSDFRSALKLLGDMYTFGAVLPPDVFGNEESGDVGSLELTMTLLQNQASFVAEGEKFYRSAEETKSSNDEDDEVFHAALACDVGTNVLLQGQILSVLKGEGQGTPSNLSLMETLMVPEVDGLFDRAEEAFKRSIHLNPLFAPAWCGLGCALAGSDPLLAQHALARAIQLDKSLPDSWANLGFLYAGRHAFKAASGVMDELTQVADTPMMWICRAAMLEREALYETEIDAKKNKLSQAADAYGAALQVMKEPTALLGIGLTCRVTGKAEMRQQSYGYMSEFFGSTSGRSVGATLLLKAMSVEDNLQSKSGAVAGEWKDEIIQDSLASIDRLSKTSREVFVAPSQHSEMSEESKDGMVDAELIAGLRNEFGPAGQVVAATEEMNIQEEIMMDPSSGKLWLLYAKILAKDLTKMKGDKRRRLVLQNIEVTTLACDKATRMLGDQITADANDVAESLALSFYVKVVVQQELLRDMKKPPEIVSPPNGYDVQLALMMCPDNRLAREALTYQFEPTVEAPTEP